MLTIEPEDCKLRHIKQKADLDCGYATGAMLAGWSYYDFGALDHANHDSQRGVSSGEMLQMLTIATEAQWSIVRANRKPIAEMANRLTCRAVVIRKPPAKFGHWIAISPSGMIHDPELSRPARPEEYLRGDWLAILSLVKR